ncbi:MAG: cysteine hydrolase family protein [Candidatus Merdivicinus sp.]|jgi:nicotinamidase-related amidase
MSHADFLAKLSEKLDAFPQWNLDQLDGKSARIFTIDMNKGFTRTGALSSPRVAALLPATRNFLKACREKDLFIAAVTDCHTPDSAELASYPAHCLDDTEEPELAPEIWEFPRKILTKNSTNAFFAPGMDKLLQNAQVVVITGCCTDICIAQFAVTLKAFANQSDLPLDVVVPRQLVDTYDAPGHPAQLLHDLALLSMAENGVRVVNYQPTKQ